VLNSDKIFAFLNESFPMALFLPVCTKTIILS
jgi:hypothetical protein